MPASSSSPTEGRAAPAYDERLAVPLWWWLVAAFLVLLLGAEFAAGLPAVAVAISYAVFGGAAVFLLLFGGAVRVGVRDGNLLAGRATLPLAYVGEVRLLDRAGMRALLGPQTDPAAWTVTRPWVKEGLAVVVNDPADDTPYWLISTRHPADFATALTGRGSPAGTPVARVRPVSPPPDDPGA